LSQEKRFLFLTVNLGEIVLNSILNSILVFYGLRKFDYKLVIKNPINEEKNVILRRLY